MEVMKDETVQENGTVVTEQKPERKIQGVEIREKTLDPFFIVGDYKGFTVYEETPTKTHKHLEFPQMQAAIMDIVKRKVGSLGKVMTLAEYNEWINATFAALNPQQQA